MDLKNLRSIFVYISIICKLKQIFELKFYSFISLINYSNNHQAILIVDIEAVKCRIKLYQINNNEKFCHQLVLIRGEIICPTLLNSYPNDINPSVGRFITVNQANLWHYQSYFIINRISINNELTAVQDQRGFWFSRASMMLYIY